MINSELNNTPLFNALKEYFSGHPTPFHMPGHKLGKGFPTEFLKNIAALDVTEIAGTDNLHFPSGPIKEAQDLAAKAFGSKNSFFLVNGSTCGIHTIIMTICKPGDKLIVARDCHKSVIGGLMLAGASPVYVRPEFNYDFGIPTVIKVSEIENALRLYPDAIGVLITRPNYYGICSDIRAIAELVHSYGKVLAVDEAHGAHLRFHGSLPESAMEAGADICVQSAHKTLAAFTQGAYLHVGSSRIDLEKLKFYLSLLQTSSPSYIIMASLDVAREVMQREGKKRLDQLINSIRVFKSNIDKSDQPITCLSCVEGGKTDITRLVINVRGLGMTGFEIDRKLREKYNIQVEMSDFCNIVCITTPADSAQDLDKLYRALEEIAMTRKGEISTRYPERVAIAIPEQKLEPGKAMSSRGVEIPLSDAAGRVSRCVITPYPPGIPLVCPGEIITMETVKYIYNIINCGGVVNGVGDNLEVSVVE
jgi:arginine/lysine/ornithine decarboxylase